MNMARDSSPMYFFISVFLNQPASTAGNVDQYFQLDGRRVLPAEVIPL